MREGPPKIPEAPAWGAVDGGEIHPFRHRIWFGMMPLEMPTMAFTMVSKWLQDFVHAQ